MAIGIDPLVDFACKQLLGSPEHPAITLHFLNALLGGSPQITDVEILNPIEQWCYFFTRAKTLTIEEIVQRLPDSVFSESAGVLEMINQRVKQRI